MYNPIVIIDSSDDDEPVKKKAKIGNYYGPNNNPVKSMQIGEIKSLAEKDVVEIEDEEDVILLEEKDTLEDVNLKMIDKALTVEQNTGNVNYLSIINTSKDITIFDIKTNKEITKIDNTRKRVELTTVAKEKDETNKDFKETDLETLLEPSTSNNDNVNIEIQENGVSSTSEEKSQAITEEFESFLDVCKNCECEGKYKQLILQKLPKLHEKYKEANEEYIKSNMFKKLLLNNISKIKRKPSDVILFFSEVYKELSGQRKRTLELTERDSRNLEKLQKFLKKINKKINQLEMADCNFEEESNSEYLMLDRYKKRATLIYKKICSITNENPYASRQIYKNLDISCSKYSEINRAIDKLYCKNKQFPSYYDVDRCVRKCVKQNNLPISDSVLTSEITKIFKHVGELLKRRRKLETYESINSLIEPSEQEEDAELEKLMDQRHIENEKRIDEYLERYTMLQEQGEDPAVSSDSDDSNHDSESSSDE